MPVIWKSMTTTRIWNPVNQHRDPPTPPLSKPPSSLLIDIHESDFLAQRHQSATANIDSELGYRPLDSPGFLPAHSRLNPLDRSASSASTPRPSPPVALPTWSFHTNFEDDDYEDLSVLDFSVWGFVLEFLYKAQALVFDILEVRGTFTGRTRMRAEGRGPWTGGGDGCYGAGGWRSGGGRFDYGRYLDGWKVGWGESP